MSGGGEESHGSGERWVISYADLVTLLLGFFIILYASAELNLAKFSELSFALSQAFNVDVKQGADGSSPLFKGGTGIVPGGNLANFVDPEVQVVREQLDKRLNEAGQPLNSAAVMRVERDIVIRLADHLLFPSASAELQPNAVPLLSVVAEVIRTTPNEVRIEGHTDDVPVATDRYPTNWELSSARATAVLRYLIDQGHIAPERMFAAGYAEFRPIAPNRTPEGRSQNRRADIVLVAPPDPADRVPSTQPQPDAPLEGGPNPATPAAGESQGGSH